MLQMSENDLQAEVPEVMSDLAPVTSCCLLRKFFIAGVPRDFVLATEVPKSGVLLKNGCF